MADDSLYERARGLMRTHPGLGKKRLADMLGVRTPTSRKLMHRYRGETQGHSDDPVYQRFRQLKEANPDWGAGRLALELGITRDHAELHLARWRGAQAGLSQGPPPPAGPATASPLAERLEQLMGGLLERLRSGAPARPAIIRPAGGEGMLEISIMDTHLGKLAWEPETGRAYNIETGGADVLDGARGFAVAGLPSQAQEDPVRRRERSAQHGHPMAAPPPLARPRIPTSSGSRALCTRER